MLVASNPSYACVSPHPSSSLGGPRDTHSNRAVLVPGQEEEGEEEDYEDMNGGGADYEEMEGVGAGLRGAGWPAAPVMAPSVGYRATAP